MSDIKAGCLGLIAVFALILTMAFAGFIVTTGNYALLPWWRQMETTANRSSYEYTSTKQALIASLRAEIATLDAEIAATNDPNVKSAKAAQQAALRNKIAVEQATLEVPR